MNDVNPHYGQYIHNSTKYPLLRKGTKPPLTKKIPTYLKDVESSSFSLASTVQVQYIRVSNWVRRGDLSAVVVIHCPVKPCQLMHDCMAHRLKI